MPYNVIARRQGAPLTLTSGILTPILFVELTIILDAPQSYRYNLPARLEKKRRDGRFAPARTKVIKE